MSTGLCLTPGKSWMHHKWDVRGTCTRCGAVLELSLHAPATRDALARARAYDDKHRKRIAPPGA